MPLLLVGAIVRAIIPGASCDLVDGPRDERERVRPRLASQYSQFTGMDMSSVGQRDDLVTGYRGRRLVRPNDHVAVESHHFLQSFP